MADYNMTHTGEQLDAAIDKASNAVTEDRVNELITAALANLNGNEVSY